LIFVTPQGLLIGIGFQLFVKFVDHFVDLEPKNWTVLTGFYSDEFDFTKVGRIVSWAFLLFTMM